MKKLTSIATAICLATGFGALCTACASEVEVNNDVAPMSAVAVSDATNYKVILCPGYQYGYGTTKNTVTGLTAMSASDEATYYVTNAYFATGGGGSTLPAAVTTRANTTFAGWAYAKDGEVVIVDKVPETLEDNLYLYAMWTVPNNTGTGGGSGNGSGNGGNQGGNNDTIPANGTKVTFKGGESVILKFTGTSSGTTYNLYAWNGGVNNSWPGTQINMGGTTNLSNISISNLCIIVNWGSSQTNDLTCSFSNGGTYTVSVSAGGGSISAG